MTQKTAGVGFRWPDADQAWQKVEEEKDELIEALQNPNNTAHIEEEYGDLLFALAAYGNYIGVNPDDALEKTNKKFRERFAYIEQKAREQGKGVQHLSLEEMIAYWKEAKNWKKSLIPLAPNNFWLYLQRILCTFLNEHLIQ